MLLYFDRLSVFYPLSAGKNFIFIVVVMAWTVLFSFLKRIFIVLCVNVPVSRVTGMVGQPLHDKHEIL